MYSEHSARKGVNPLISRSGKLICSSYHNLYPEKHKWRSLALIVKKTSCYTSQVKYDFRLEDNVSRVMGQTHRLPRAKTPREGNNNLNFRLARDEVVSVKTEANLCHPLSSKEGLFTIYPEISDGKLNGKINFISPNRNVSFAKFCLFQAF